MLQGLVDRLLLPVSMLRIAITQPGEFVDRLDGKRENERQNARGRLSSETTPPNRSDALDAAHEVLGIVDCSACVEEVSKAEKSLLGGAYSRHQFDGGQTLVRVLWAVIRHRQPEYVVETGVARGVSSAFVLEALERNGSGNLWSIDLPPIRSSAQVDVGGAVPDRLRHRWTYLRGASRRRLPPLLDKLDGVDVFIHDGLHTPETMTWEFHHVWPYLKSGDVIVADDANVNQAFVKFANRVGRTPLLVAEQEKDAAVGLVGA